MSQSALQGVKVVELATMISGPYCGKLLADMGAEVIKVEPPEGDPARQVGPFPNDEPHPERSGLFLYNNTSKRGMMLDLDDPAGLEKFQNLIEWADILIENISPTYLSDRGLAWENLKALNPRLIYTSIYPYGRTGPRALQKADELTIIHAGGLGFTLPGRQVDVSRAPVKLGGSQVGYWGAATAALATMATLLGQRETGVGQQIDISLQEVILATVQINITSVRYINGSWIGSRVPTSPPGTGRMETKDGYVLLTAMDDRHFLAFRKLLGDPEYIAGKEWESRLYRYDNLKKVAPQLSQSMLNYEKHDLHFKAGKMGIPVGPINTIEDVMKSEQYAVREYFTEVEHPEAGAYKYPGWPYIMKASPPRVSRPAPLLAQHNDEILNDPEIMGSSVKASAPKAGQAAKLPLAGIRILEFCQMWAGPYATQLLGGLGAEIIRVESHNRLDAMRRGVTQKINDTKMRLVSPNQNIGFSCLNMSKKDVTIDMARPEGLELVKKLVAISDVVFDNYRAGAMDKLGMGYDELKKIKPDIIAMSSSGRGQQEPERDFKGYAMIHQSIGGGAYLNGYPDDAPISSGGDVDLINAIAAAEAMLAAVYHHRQTGEGQFIDFSQSEFVSSALGEYFLEYQMTGRIPERMANAHPVYAPHNVYKTWGLDRWVALEVHSDEEFAVLARVIERPELAKDPKFATMRARKQNEAELDAIIQEWTSQQERDHAEETLIEAGLMASMSKNGRDLYQDEQLRARNAFQTIQHPEMEDMEMVRAPWLIDGEVTPFTRAPLLGEHNDYVFKELLNLGDDQISDLLEKAIIITPEEAAKLNT
jgi:crotonobetainyl-CoA:carnitine CoA-transferase CaiB-like acyl-CoA transferase